MKVLQNVFSIFVVGALVRIVLVIVMLHQAKPAFCCMNEAGSIAASLVAGHGFSNPWPGVTTGPTAHMAPLYPAFSALVFRLFGTDSTAAAYVLLGSNALASAIVGVLIVLIGMCFLPGWAATLSGWTWALLPYAIMMVLRYWETTWAMLMLCLWLFLLMRTQDKFTSWNALLLGVVSGSGSLTSPVLMSVFGPCWIWMCLRERRCRGAYRNVVISVAVCAAIIAPWMIRNRVVFNRWFFLRDNFGLELSIGNNPRVTDIYNFSDFPMRDPSEFKRVGEINFYDQKRREAQQFILENPNRFLHLCFRRVTDYWTTKEWRFWGPISIAGWLGLLLLVHDFKSKAIPFAIVMVCFPFTYYVTHTYVWYRHPIEPVIVLLLIYLLWRVEVVLRKLCGTRTEVPLACSHGS